MRRCANQHHQDPHAPCKKPHGQAARASGGRSGLGDHLAGTTLSLKFSVESVMQVSQLVPRIVPYIAGATMAAFALIYCQQSLGTSFNPSDRISFQSETAQPMNIVDRSHKGDRLFGGQQTVASGNMELVPMTAPVSDAPRSPSVLPESAFSSMSAVEQKTAAARCLT